ncbi:MAG: outer membrane beta-barrel protein [Bacteroidota bacterium]
MKISFRSALTFICLSFTLIHPTFSQTYLGLNAGAGITKGNGLTGLNGSVGAFVETPLAERVNLRAGVAYAYRDLAQHLGIDPEGDFWDLNLLYLPVTIKFRMLESKTYPFLNIGGAYGLLDSPRMASGHREPISDIRRAEADMILGMGYNFKLGQGIFFLEMQYRQSLNNIIGKQAGESLQPFTFDVLHFGIAFPLGD